MAIEKILTYDTELNEDIGYTVHPISLALGESNGHTIKVNVLRGGTKVTDSATCKGKFLRADGSTVEFNGTFSSGIASVTLPSSCYTKEGACKLSVYLVSGSQISCVFVLVANVLKYTSTEIVDTNQVVPNIETLLANVAKIEAIANDADVINKKIGHVEKSGNTILFYSDSTKSRLIASVDIPAGSGGGTAAPYDDTYLRENKVGYAEFEDGILKMYSDATKAKLIRQVTIPTGSGGGLTDAQVQTLIDNSLSTVNEGLSELEDRVLTLEKRPSGGDGESIVVSDNLKMSNVLRCGKIFEKPNPVADYVGWPFYCVQYDKLFNQIVFMINSGYVHGENDNYDLYIGRMNLNTYEVTVSEFLKHDVVGYGCYCCGFSIANDGTYRAILTNANKMYTSANHGETWSVTDIGITDAFGLQQLSNGYFICYNNENGIVYYSEDNCSSWNESVGSSGGKHERCIIELEDGNLVSIGRKTWQGTNNGSWNGTKIIEPAIVQYSADYGKNWSQAFESTTITEMTACNACGFYHKEERCIELFVTSRYPHGDSIGVMYQYIATLDDAMNDRWGSPKVVLYPTAKVAQDYGYVGGCKDGNGDMHIMYYDGNPEVEGDCDYNYIKASREQALLPLTSGLDGSFIPYSAKTVDSLMSAMYSKLMEKINNIIISGGGAVEDENFYTTDALKFNFTEFGDGETIVDGSGNTATVATGNKGTTYTTGATGISTPSFAIEVGLYPNVFGGGGDQFYMLQTANYITYTARCFYQYNGSQAIYTAKDGTTKAGDVFNFSNGFVSGKNRHVILNFNDDGTISVYTDGNLSYTTDTPTDFGSWDILHSTGLKFSCEGTDWGGNVINRTPFVWRIYEKALSESEIEKNYTYFKDNY